MKCKICGGEIKPGELECRFCGNADFIPEMFSEKEFESEKDQALPRQNRELYRDLTGDETVVVRNTKPVHEKFCRKCGRELNPNGKCRVCDNDNSDYIRSVSDNEDEQVSSRKNKRPQNDKMNPALKLVLIILLMLVLFAISYMIFFNWMKGLTEQEQEQTKPTATPVVVTNVPIDDSSDKARWKPTNTLEPSVSTIKPASEGSTQKPVPVVVTPKPAPTPSSFSVTEAPRSPSSDNNKNDLTKNDQKKDELIGE